MQQCVQGCPVLCWSTRTWGCAGNSPAWSREICLASSVVPLILAPPSPTVDVSEVSLGTFAAWLSCSICPAGLQTEAGVKAGGSRQRPHRDSALPARLPPGTERSVIKPLAADASRSCAVVSPVWGSCRSPRAPIAFFQPHSHQHITTFSSAPVDTCCTRGWCNAGCDPELGSLPCPGHGVSLARRKQEGCGHVPIIHTCLSMGQQPVTVVLLYPHIHIPIALFMFLFAECEPCFL